MIRKSMPSDLIRGWEPVFAKDHDLVPGITNRYCSPSFETATEPVIGRAFARPVGGLLRMRSNLLKHNNLMLRSERRERLEAWAASDSPISHSRYYRVAIRSSSSSTSACRAGGNGLSDNAKPRNAQ